MKGVFIPIRASNFVQLFSPRNGITYPVLHPAVECLATTKAFASQRMADGTISIYNHPNPQIKSFLTQEDLFPPLVVVFKNPLDETADEDLKKIGIFGSQIVRDISSLSGVKEFRVKPKEIRLTKEEQASWDDIEVKVFQILDRALRKKQIKRIK